MSELQPIPIKPIQKIAIGIHKGGLNCGYAEALEDLLKDNPTYQRLKKLAKEYTPDKEEVIDLNKLEVEDLI